MEQNENFFAPDAATDEPAVVASILSVAHAEPEHPPSWLYWQGIADGIRRCGGIVPAEVLRQAGLKHDPSRRTDDGRDMLDFAPVVVRERHDGWTPAKQREFIEHLADCGIIRRAAALVGMTEQSVNRLRRRADARAFDIACDAAQRLGARRLQSIAWERAIEGTVKGHYYHGELKSQERVWNDRLLIYLLGRTRRFDQPAPQAEPVLADWDGWMEAIEQGLPEPVPSEAEGPIDEPSEFNGTEVWEEEGQWWTQFPPPPDFDGCEYGDYGDPGYKRWLSDAEQAVIDADLGDDRTTAEARRDRYFGFDEAEDFSAMQAEPSSPSDAEIRPRSHLDNPTTRSS